MIPFLENNICPCVFVCKCVLNCELIVGILGGVIIYEFLFLLSVFL